MWGFHLQLAPLGWLQSNFAKIFDTKKKNSWALFAWCVSFCFVDGRTYKRRQQIPRYSIASCGKNRSTPLSCWISRRYTSTVFLLLGHIAALARCSLLLFATGGECCNLSVSVCLSVCQSCWLRPWALQLHVRLNRFEMACGGQFMWLQGTIC